MASDPQNPGPTSGKRPQDEKAAADYRSRPSFGAAVERLRERAKLPHEQAANLMAAVVCALDQRMTDEGTPAEEHPGLPAPFREVFGRCEKHANATLGYGREFFLRQIADEVGRSVDAVEPLARQALLALREPLSEAEAEDVSRQLPMDLQDLWLLAV